MLQPVRRTTTAGLPYHHSSFGMFPKTINLIQTSFHSWRRTTTGMDDRVEMEKSRWMKVSTRGTNGRKWMNSNAGHFQNPDYIKENIDKLVKSIEEINTKLENLSLVVTNLNNRMMFGFMGMMFGFMGMTILILFVKNELLKEIILAIAK
jgi:hypothetical protein